MDDDLHAIEQVLGGDVEAFRAVVERYQGPLFSLIRSLVDNRTDAEDVAQDTFLAAYTHLGSYDPKRGAFSTWLFTIARNRCRNALKKRRPVPMAHVPESPIAAAPDARLARQETCQQLDAALAALPFAQRAAFVLAEIQGLPYDQIAAIERVRLGTVKSRVSRARQKLRAALQPTKETR